tara:strand:- start:217 stop:333 length:117 start_codon:yes stop_codon:yes gene_type:complete
LEIRPENGSNTKNKAINELILSNAIEYSANNAIYVNKV